MRFLLDLIRFFPAPLVLGTYSGINPNPPPGFAFVGTLRGTLVVTSTQQLVAKDYV